MDSEDYISNSTRASPKSPAPAPHSPVQLRCDFEFEESVNDSEADHISFSANEPTAGCALKMRKYSRDGSPALMNKRGGLSIGDSPKFSVPAAICSTSEYPQSTSCDHPRSPTPLLRPHDTVNHNGDEYLCMLYERYSQVTTEMDTLKAELLQLMREEWTLTGVVPDGFEALQSQVQRCTQPIKNTSYRLPRSVLHRASTIGTCRERPVLKRFSQTSIPDSTSYWPPRRLDQPNAAALPDKHGNEANFFNPLSPAAPTAANTAEQPPIDQTPHHQSFPSDAFHISSEVQADPSTKPALCQNVTSVSPGAMGVENNTQSAYGSTKPNSSFDPPLGMFEEEIDIERAAAELRLRRLEVDHAVISHLHKVHKQRAAETKRDAYKIAYRTNYQKLRQIEEQMKHLRAELDYCPTSILPGNRVNSSNCAFRTRKTWKPLCSKAKNWALATFPRRSSTCLSPAKSKYHSWDTVSSPCSPNVRIMSLHCVPQPPPSIVSGSISLSTSGTSSIVSGGIAESVEDQPYPIRAQRRRRQSLLPLFRIFKHSKHTSSMSERVDEPRTIYDHQMASELSFHTESNSSWKTVRDGDLHCASEKRIVTREKDMLSFSQRTENCIEQIWRSEQHGELGHSRFNDTQRNCSSGGIMHVNQPVLPSCAQGRVDRLRHSTSTSSVIERNEYSWNALDHIRHEVARTRSLPILNPLNDNREIHIHGFGDAFLVGSTTIGDSYPSNAFKQWRLKGLTTIFKPNWASDPPNSPISNSSMQHLTAVATAGKDTPDHLTSKDTENVSPSWSTSGCSCMSSQTAGSTSPCDSGCFSSSKATDSAVGLYSCQSLKSDTSAVAIQSVPSTSQCPSSGLPVKLREPCDRGRRVVTCNRGASSTTESEAYGSTFHVKCICSCISELLPPESTSHICHKNSLPIGAVTDPLLNSPDTEHANVSTNIYAVSHKARNGSSGSCDVTLIRSPVSTASSSVSSVNDSSPISCTYQKSGSVSSRNKQETTPNKKTLTGDSKSASFFRRAVTRITSTRDSMRSHEFSSSSLYRRRRFTAPRVVPTLLTRKHSEFKEFFKLGRHEHETSRIHFSQNSPVNSTPTSNALSPKCTRVSSVRFSTGSTRCPK